MTGLDGFPSKGDPRIPFSVIMTAYVVSGITWMGFNRSPMQVLVIVGLACVLDIALHRLVRGKWLFPLSAYISAMSLVLILNFAHGQAVLVVPVLLAIASKYVITTGGRHFYNPSLFGITVSLLFFGDLITTAPAYQWHGTWAVSFFIVTAALSLFVFKVGRHWLVGTFMVAYLAQLAIRAVILRHHLPPEVLILGTLSSPPFYLFLFFMLPDPKTSPASKRGQIAVAMAIVGVDLVLHLFENLYTFYYAAFIVASCRLLYAVVNDWRKWDLSTSFFKPVRTPAVLALVTLLAVTSVHNYSVSPAAAQTTDFRLEAQPIMAVEMDPTVLQQVDPRVAHVAKWILSVGSAAVVADVDGDGRQDMLSVNPLAVPGDRLIIWRNEGSFRFSRLTVPTLEVIALASLNDGLASGGLFSDIDNDGDPDLVVLRSFGRSRLLENRLSTGESFVDITEHSGFPLHTVSINANALDYDRDGFNDLFIANVMDPHLDGYARRTPLNIFDLPAPEYDGDRRMLKFMHDGWHNATNGGENVLLRNRGDGSFEPVDMAEIGMTETHWSLATATGDLNQDGYPDLYVANDFGPDDLYMNQGNGRFAALRGRWFGDVGRDTYKGMNATTADFDRNGHMDVYVSDVHHSLQAEGSLLWMNSGPDGNGQPRLRDEAANQGALNPDRFGWGAAAVDLDNNGWVDLVQANGMVGDRLDDLYEGCPDYWYVNQKMMQAGPEIHTYADRWGDLRGRCTYPDEKRRVYLNRGDGASPRFIDAADAVGLTQGDNSRAVAAADFDDDGRVDVVIANQHGSPTVLHNQGDGEVAPWLGIELNGAGRRCSVDALGSRITVTMPGQPPLVKEVSAANGLSAQSDSRVHFGLGSVTARFVDVEVNWCGAEVQRYRLDTNRYHVVNQ